MNFSYFCPIFYRRPYIIRRNMRRLEHFCLVWLRFLYNFPRKVLRGSSYAVQYISTVVYVNTVYHLLTWRNYCLLMRNSVCKITRNVAAFRVQSFME
jgi:hypothetical protein